MEVESTMKISVALMTCAGREDSAREVLDQLDYDNVWIQKDEHLEGTVQNGFKSWEASRKMPSTHHMVLEDDIDLCRDFIPTVKRAVAARPRSIISFFGMSKVIASAPRWAVGRTISWNQAVVMPAFMGRDFVRWSKFHLRDMKFFSTVLGMYALAHDLPIYYTNPCLVEHRLPEDSTLGNPARVGGRDRVAANFIGKNTSGLGINWNEHLDKTPRMPGWSWKDYANNYYEKGVMA
jgi:hypothetical protein